MLAGRFWARVAREPLVHFAVLAGLLFAAQGAFLREGKPRIEVDAALIEAQMRERSALLLRPLTTGEREAAVEAAIADEILLKEAYRRGLNNTPRVRALLLLTMRRILAGEVAPPDEAALRRYFEAERERFRRPSTLDLVQVAYAEGTPVALPDGAERAGQVLRGASEADLVRMFGAEAARAILAIADEGWHGPIRSVRGVHFVRIAGRTAAAMPEFEAVAPYLAQEWEMDEEARRMRAMIASLGRGYEIVRPGR